MAEFYCTEHYCRRRRSRRSFFVCQITSHKPPSCLRDFLIQAKKMEWERRKKQNISVCGKAINEKGKKKLLRMRRRKFACILCSQWCQLAHCTKPNSDTFGFHLANKNFGIYFLFDITFFCTVASVKFCFCC